MGLNKGNPKIPSAYASYWLFPSREHSKTLREMAQSDKLASTEEQGGEKVFVAT